MSTENTKTETPSLRLARYLKEFVGLRSTTVRDVAKYESALWFSDMPQEADCRSGAWTDDWDPEEPWLEVRKQVFDSPPVPPEVTGKWVDNKALQRATPDIPPLRTSIFVEDADAELEEGETAPLVEQFLSDHPEVVAAYQAFRPKWEAWAIEDRRRHSVQQVYADLFRLHTQLKKQGEIVEVVLGLGLVDWRAKLGQQEIAIRRHAVVAQVDLSFDPANGVIRVVAPSEGAKLRLEDDMMEAELRPERSQYAAVQAQFQDLGDAVWDKPLMQAALKTWAGALSADAIWFEGISARRPSGNDPVVSFAPALILRKRPQTGMVRIYEKLIEQLQDRDGAIPDGWGRLTDDDWSATGDSAAEPTEPGRDRGLSTAAQSETYFPLPANREQRRIVSALDRNQGVLVQGPPGTGKSHTIANLICHLLATGKRVLITAETSRALRVLKDKLPNELQPLCISLLGQGGDAFSELNASVQEITNRHSSYSPGAYEDRIAEIDRELDQTRRHLAQIDGEIQSLRESETSQHSLLDGEYQGTASKIAARVAEERERFGWLCLAGNITAHPPISNAEATRWLEIRRRYSNTEVEASTLQVPDSSKLPSPKEFASLVSDEIAAQARSEQVSSVRSHPAFSAIRAWQRGARSDLKDSLKKIEEQRLSLQRLQAEWLSTALQESLEGRGARWQTLLQLSKERIESAEPLLARVDGRAVSRPEGLDLRKLRADAGAAIDHLRAGGKWTWLGLATPKALKGRTYLRQHVLVDGQPADDAEKLEIVRDELDFEFALADLLVAWKDVGVTELARDRRLRLASLKATVSALASALKYAAECDQIVRHLSRTSPPIPVPDWLNGDVQQWIEMVDAAAIDEEQTEAERKVNLCGHALQELRHLHDVHPVVGRLLAAIRTRNVTAYSQGHSCLLSVERTREDQAVRRRVESAIHTATNGLIEEVEASLDDLAWNDRFLTWEEAWRWAVANSWLEKRSDFGYQRDLWLKRRAAELLIGRLVAETAALRAWAHFFDRLSGPESSALKSWREAVRAMGKGTGKSAKIARLRREARLYMDACRDAIPVWIMPRYLVAEMIDPSPGRYDLVIVDEASQLGIESLFLFYISKKMIVVGDDQQISPAGVGVADAAVENLQHHFLDGVPHKHALSPQSSLYGNAKIRLNQNIVLREHFRCMPEIIQFSNDLCYASNGTPLDPLRAYPANRLEPLLLRHVPEGYRQGSTQHAQNLPEAEAIVRQICACIEDPRYADASMGVISLQGEAQAKLIERLLLATLDPAVIEARRLVCGDAYAFQGDERTVIFLSMVAASGTHRIGVLSNESARQRFNVAVSRAQDQLWLFHSAELDSLSESCMRYRLLSYMLNPRRQMTEESDQRFDSEFERHVYQRVTRRGFHVRTQVSVGDPINHRYRIDLVVEGMQGRLAVECDGDKWHGADRYEQDMSRQRDLERAGWQFARIRGGDFYRDPEKALKPVWLELDRLGIQPGGIDGAAAEPPKPKSVDLGGGIEAMPEQDRGQAPLSSEPSADSPTGGGLLAKAETIATSSSGLEPATKDSAVRPIDHANSTTQPEVLPPFAEPPQVAPVSMGAAAYVAFEGLAGPDPRESTPAMVAVGLCRIIDIEGPLLAKRAYDLYLRGVGIRRMGGELKKAMNKALQHAIRSGQVVKQDEAGKSGLLYSTVRLAGTPAVKLRERGPREFEEIPPSELQLVARRLSRREGFDPGSDAHLRAVLEFFGLKRLTAQVGTRLLDAIDLRCAYVDEMMKAE